MKGLGGLGGVGGAIAGRGGVGMATFGGVRGGIGLGVEGGRSFMGSSPVRGLARMDSSLSIKIGSPVARPGSMRTESFSFGGSWKKAEVSSFSNDIRGSSAEFKNTMPLQIGQVNPVKEIKFNYPSENFVAPLRVAETVAAAESILAKARAKNSQIMRPRFRVVQPGVIPEIKPLPFIVKPRELKRVWHVARPQVEPVARPAVLPLEIGQPEPNVVSFPTGEPAVKTENARVVKAKAEVKPSASIASAPREQAAPKEQELEEVIEERVLVKQDQKDKPQAKEQENPSMQKVKFVEAKKVSKARREKIEAAAKKIKESGKKLLAKLVRGALSADFWKDISPIAKNGKDFTIDLTVREIESDIKEYETPEEASRVWVQAIESNIPVEKGEGERNATIDEVRKVIHGDNRILKTDIPAEIIERRVAKKTIILAQAGEASRVLEDKTDRVEEGNLKDLNLEDVFLPKAA